MKHQKFRDYLFYNRLIRPGFHIHLRFIRSWTEVTLSLTLEYLRLQSSRKEQRLADIVCGGWRHEYDAERNPMGGGWSVTFMRRPGQSLSQITAIPITRFKRRATTVGIIHGAYKLQELWLMAPRTRAHMVHLVPRWFIRQLWNSNR